jgi:hypothetical protein
MSARLAALWRCAGRACRAKPNLLLRVARRSCRFDADIRGPEARKIEQVEFLVRRRSPEGTQDAPDRDRRLSRDRIAPFRARLLPTGVRPGHRFRLRARMRLDDGRALTLDTRRRTCRQAPLSPR